MIRTQHPKVYTLISYQSVSGVCFNMDDESDPMLVEQFMNITGSTESRAKALLKACNGNLEMAIGMHLEEAEMSENHTQGESTSHECVGEDNHVRAPIPQKRGVLVEGPYRVSRPRRCGNQSVFDAFRDFQAEAKEQEQKLSGNLGNGKRRTLKDLFKPPLDIMHKGTFDTAKIAGEQEGKWLIVNVQDSKEFKCQQLNRDVWSNEAVRSIMAEHFLLWQVYHDSDDGDRYIQFYHVTKFPHLAVLDPRTGEKLVEWETVDAESFCEVATEFLLNHSLGKESNGCLPPAAKRRKRESIIDASEDSQLEAAIAASLKETSTAVSASLPRDKEYIYTPDEDSLTEFTDSESESEKPPKDTIGNNSPKNENRTRKVKWEDNHCKDKEKSVKDDTCFKENQIAEKRDVKKNDERGKDSEPDDEGDNTLDPDGVKASIMLRYPNGKRKQKTFSAEATILDLIKYVQSQGYSNERYELVTNFPRKKLSYMDSDLSLKDARLFPRETVFVQERIHESSS